MMVWIKESTSLTPRLQAEIDWRVLWCRAQKWMYYHGGDSIQACSDTEFDAMENELKTILFRFIPNHEYLTEVGAPIEPSSEVIAFVDKIKRERAASCKND